MSSVIRQGGFLLHEYVRFHGIIGIGTVVGLTMQQRSAAKRKQILDTAAQSIAENGYDGVTTNLVAERSGVPVGTLYRHFKDKRAILAALAVDYKRECGKMLRSELLAKSTIASSDEMVATKLVKLMRTFYELYPVGGLLLVAEVHKDFSEVGLELRNEFIGVFGELFALRHPALSAKECELRAMVCFNALRSVMWNIPKAGTASRASLSKETVRMIAGYLTNV